MKVYQRRVKIDGFHVLQESGVSAEVQCSFLINIEGEWKRESITQWFNNIGDAPHIGEFITIEVRVFDMEGDVWTLEMIGW